LMDDAQLRDRMGQVGRERIETALAWPYQAKALLKAYETLFLANDRQLQSKKIRDSAL